MNVEILSYWSHLQLTRLKLLFLTWLLRKRLDRMGNLSDLGIGFFFSDECGGDGDNDFGRVVLSSALQFDDFIPNIETKKPCREISFPSYDKSLLESFPQDVLIRIILGLDHDDLSRLFHVSKTIREMEEESLSSSLEKLDIVAVIMKWIMDILLLN
ncbi:F-box protein At1g61340-like [Ipomoea triloba]|uniref:F-box protein At1g61340-like n=1 Tax=Ipomoea triloba TaxID=35885 RepID=UPI00125E1B91|nr:F-box protein At1g61340-like [Ipomoea triloba]